MFEKLLDYQKLDGELLSIKKEAEKNPAKENLNRTKALVLDSQKQLLSLDTSAKLAIAEYEKCKADFEKDFANLESLSKKDTSKLDMEQLNEVLEEISKLTNHLSNLERMLSSQAENINKIMKNSQDCKKSIVLNKQKYNENKAKFEETTKKFLPKIEELKAKMATIEKTIDPKIFARYKHLRADHIFPAFVPLNGTSCGGCSMEIPSALMSKLKSQGFLECEQCRRIVYMP